MKKYPPLGKIYEAWTALADGRVHMKKNEGEVTSSDGTKHYLIRWSGNQYSSDDNSTYWQGYPGYPVIAVMMLQGKLPYDEEEAALWKGVNWNAINKKYKNKYAEAVAEVIKERGINPDSAHEKAQKVMEALQGLDIEIKRKIKV